MNTIRGYVVFNTLFAVLSIMPLAYGEALAPGLVTPDELRWATRLSRGSICIARDFPPTTKSSRISIRMSVSGW